MAKVPNFATLYVVKKYLFFLQVDQYRFSLVILMQQELFDALVVVFVKETVDSVC